MQTWKLQTAKARLSELVKAAQVEGPQEITVRGEPAVVVMSRAHYDQLEGMPSNLVEFMQASPLMGLDIDFERDRSGDRDVGLF